MASWYRFRYFGWMKELQRYDPKLPHTTDKQVPGPPRGNNKEMPGESSGVEEKKSTQ